MTTDNSDVNLSGAVPNEKMNNMAHRVRKIERILEEKTVSKGNVPE